MAKENTVDLVVKARNEASKNLDIITEAWKELKAEMSSAGSSTSKANSSLSQLGNALGNLVQKAKGLSALNSIASTVDQASGAVKQLESTVRDGANELAKLAREAQVAEQNLNRLKGQVAAETAANREAIAARKAANVELAAASKALKDAERNQEKLNNSVARAPKSTPGVSKTIGAPQTSARDSAAVFVAADLEQARVAQSQAAAVAKQYADEVEKSSAALKDLAPKLKAAESFTKSLTGETTKQNTVLQQNRNLLAQSREEQDKIEVVAAQASAAMGGLALKEDAVAAASAKTTAEIERTRRAIEALSKFSSGGEGFVDPKSAVALQKQSAAVNELRDDWKALEGEARNLAVSLQSVSGNATPQVDAFKRITDAARRAKTEYQNQVTALDKLRVAAGLPVSGLGKLTQETEKVAVATNKLYSGASLTLPPIRAMGSAAQNTAAGVGSAASNLDKLDSSLRSSTSSGRQSLSLFQRIRGEVIALAAAYIGLQGTISALSGVISAVQALESAQSRLGVAFNGDNARVAQEIAYLQSNADRLGISFQTLSDQYSKFAVAAQGANFSAQSTRDIFMSVAEAGRVLKLSDADLQGVFKALEQMISKGKVSAEELRGQLGDRMTGAFKLFADAIGVSTSALDKMMKKGEVLANEDTLGKLGDRLQEIYGPQLAQALAGTTAEIGRFKNNLFEGQLLAGGNGFVKSFTDGLRQLNQYFQSREGRDFFLAIGSALTKVTQGLITVMPYMDDLAKVVAVLAAIKLANTVSGWSSNLIQSGTAAGTSAASLFTWQSTVAAAQGKWNAFAAVLTTGTGRLAALRLEMASTVALAPRVGAGFITMRVGLAALQTAAGLTAGAFRLLWAAIGGLPGLILTGVTVALGSWLTSVDSTTSALDEHKRIMGEVLNSYEAVKGKTDEWASKIKNVSVDQISANLRKLKGEYDDTVAAATSETVVPFKFWQKDIIAAAGTINTLNSSFRNGEITAQQYKEGLDQLYSQTASDSAKAYIETQLELARKIVASAEAIDLEREAGEKLGGQFEFLNDHGRQTTATLDSMAKVAEDTGKALEAKILDSAEGINKALDAMGKLIPSVAEDLKQFEKIEGLNKQYQDALKLARTMGQVMELTNAYNKALTATTFGNVGSSGSEAAFNIIKQFEGFQGTAKWDVNAYRAGFGSDTVTLADGSVKKITEGMTVNLADATRDLTRRVDEFATIARDQTGGSRFDAMSPQQQGVLTSLSYNYGDLKSTGILDTIQKGSNEEISAAIRSLGTHNDGINKNRRNQEADLFSTGASGDLTDKQIEQERKRAVKAQEYNKELENRISLQENENSNAGKLTEEGFIQKKLAEEQKKAKEAGVVLSDEQISKIKQVAAEEYKVTQEKRDQKTEQKDANLALQEAQALESKRNALMAQFKQAVSTGDATAQESLKTQITDLNGQIVTAAESAKKMWEAIGGADAAAKIPMLDALITKAKTAGTQMEIVGKKTNSLGLTANQTQQLVGSFADGLVGVFDSFAQAVANGEDAFSALGTAFLNFAATFLREIATMILKQMVLNALAGFSGGVGSAATALGGVAHGGGVAGSTVRSREVSASTFGPNAARYHTGGVAGLKSDEVPAILQRGEVIRTQAQEAALQEKMNTPQSTGSGGGDMNIRNVITLDSDSAHNWLTSSAGEKAIWSVLGKDKSKLRSLSK